MQRNYLKLLEVVQYQAETIKKQSAFIDSLVNENLEKENMVNILVEDIENSYE